MTLCGWKFPSVVSPRLRDPFCVTVSRCVESPCEIMTGMLEAALELLVTLYLTRFSVTPPVMRSAALRSAL